MKCYLTNDEIIKRELRPDITKKLGCALSDYQWRSLNELKTDFTPYEGIENTEVVYCITFEESDGKYYHGYAGCEINYKGTVMIPFKKKYNEPKYGFTLGNATIFPMDYCTDFLRANPMPNFIGKPTAKKLAEWRDWVLLKEKTLSDRVKSECDYRQNFIASIPEPIVWEKAYRWNDECWHGRIKRNGLTLKIQLYTNSVWLKIEADYIFTPTYDKFIAMADALKRFQNPETK
jgi:hypothetical protein